MNSQRPLAVATTVSSFGLITVPPTELIATLANSASLGVGTIPELVSDSSRPS